MDSSTLNGVDLLNILYSVGEAAAGKFCSTCMHVFMMFRPDSTSGFRNITVWSTHIRERKNPN
jgi:hypothetical protein